MAEGLLVPSVLVSLTFVATTVHGLTSFAFAVTMMPNVTLLLDIRTAAPLVALTALTLHAVSSLRYRASLNLLRSGDWK